MTDWNEHFLEIINHDPAKARFEERLPTISPELKAGVEELRKIEANVATVDLLRGRYETYWQLPNSGFDTYTTARMHFIRAKRYPFQIPDFKIGFWYQVGEGLMYERNNDFKEREPITVEDATMETLKELKHLL